MPEVVYYVAASLDGCIATPDGGVEWLAPFEGTAEDYGYTKFYASVDAVILGRKTYEKSLSFGEWPYPGKPCWVFSRGGAEVSRPDVKATARSPAEVVAEIAALGLSRAWLVGGGELAAAFRSQGLITEHIVSVVPVILGAGIPLFASGGAMESLKLSESRSYPSGLVQLRYVRA